jgi:preprotein translocase subunit SecG
LTAWLALAFFAISFGLAYLAKDRALSLRDAGMPAIEEVVPAVPDVTAPSAGEAAGSEQNAPAKLTVPEETVDSDIPDV